MENIEKSLLLKKELDSYRPLSKDNEKRIMDKFRLDWNYHSNHLEGNTLTYGETKALILFGVTANGKPLKDHFEVTGHNEAIHLVLDIIKQERPLSEAFIRELHQLLLKESYEKDTITPDGIPGKRRIEVGVYKKVPNHVKTNTGEIFRFASPEETPAKMEELIHWYRDKVTDTNTNPILLAAEFHYRFIRIHPFDDGNGRVARIIMNFILMQFGYPPVIIKTEDKENYFNALRQADAGELTKFIDYIAQNLNHSLELMIKGAKGESIEEEDDLAKELALLEQKLSHVNQRIELTKNKENIKNVYTNSIKRLENVFSIKCSLFKNFYFENKYEFEINGKHLQNIDNITDGTTYFNLSHSFSTLKYDTEENNYISNIHITFHNTKYQILINGNLIYSKLYNEQLTDNEIKSLVKIETDRHQAFIASKIDEPKN